MKSEIEQVLSCDETARARVRQAQEEADDIIKEAQEEAGNIKAQIEKTLRKTREEKIRNMIQEAEKQARDREEKGLIYTKTIKKRYNEKKEKIIDQFLAEVLGFNPTSPNG